MPRHTTGPWSRNIPPASKYAVVFAGRNTHVAVICSQGLTHDEVEANCDLVTAAPDLLKVLTEIQTWLISPDLSDSTLRDIRSMVRDAIVQACPETADHAKQ